MPAATDGGARSPPRTTALRHCARRTPVPWMTCPSPLPCVRLEISDVADPQQLENDVPKHFSRRIEDARTFWSAEEPVVDAVEESGRRVEQRQHANGIGSVIHDVFEL